MKQILLILLMLSTLNGEDNPWEDEEDPECYAEAGMNCEELAEEWAEENEGEDDE